MKKREGGWAAVVSVALAAALMFTGGGCSKAGKKEGAAPRRAEVKEYRIGAIISVTGKAAFLGEPQKKTLEMLEKEVNAAGGINGVPLKIIIEDDAGEESKSVTALSRLADRDGVLAIIGPSRSGNSLAVKALAGERGVPLISCAAAEEILDRDNPWVFKVAPNDSFVAKMILEDMSKNGISKIAVLYDNTGFGQEGMKQIEKFAGDAGMTIGFREAFQPAATEADLEILLTKVKSDGSIQAIINWSILPAQSVVPVKMKQLGMDGLRLYHSHGFADIRYAEMAGAAADMVIFPAQKLVAAEFLPDDDPQKSALMKYKKEYETRYNEEVSTFGGHAYDAFWIVVDALRKSGADRAALRDEIEKTAGFAGAGGVFTFSKEDHAGLQDGCLEMLTVRNGKFVPLSRAD